MGEDGKSGIPAATVAALAGLPLEAVEAACRRQILPGYRSARGNWRVPVEAAREFIRKPGPPLVAGEGA